jgi:NAD(P)H-flavin reductase
VLVVAGGLGLAPLRPLLLEVLRDRDDHGRVMLIAGARHPQDLLYRTELERWAAEPGLEVELTVDRATPGWEGAVGFVTEPLARLPLDPARTVTYLCGPEPMMRFSAHLLAARGIPPARIQLSLERTMLCGVGLCGHCQLGPVLLCRDGPVLDYARAGGLMEIREL